MPPLRPFLFSSAGGRENNKTSSAVVLTHTPTKVSAEGFERRSQHQNLRAAQRRLRVALALKVRAAAVAGQMLRRLILHQKSEWKSSNLGSCDNLQCCSSCFQFLFQLIAYQRATDRLLDRLCM